MTIHRKIRSMCVIQRSGEGHWILTGSKTMWAAEIQQVVTTKRAAYAAFVDSVPAGMQVVSMCGCDECIRPEHMALEQSHTRSRELGLPMALAELAHPGRKEFRDEDANDPVLLPKGLKIETVLLVKHLADDGVDVASIVARSGASRVEVAKIRGGVYDKAVKNSRSSAAALRDAKVRRIDHGEPEESRSKKVEKSIPRLAPSEAKPLSMTPEEEAWLSSVRLS